MEGGGGMSSILTTTDNSSNYIYRECLRNHAASLGSYATDGCGEFTLEDDGAGSLQCAACGCHRNFHRKVVTAAYPATASHVREVMEYSGGGGGEGLMRSNSNSNSSKKRYRTKFTAEQKEKMMGFAEKLGWKLQRKELDEEIERFCESVGVSRQIFKVWMHNHKNSSSSFSSGNASSLTQ